MFKFLENSKLQKDIWFALSTLIFLVVILYFRSRDFLPYGMGLCIGYVVLISSGFILINIREEKRNRKK